MFAVDLSSLRRLVDDVRAGRTSAQDLVEAALERIGQVEESVAAWVRVDAAGALAHARRLDAGPVRGPLHGVPFGVKDIVDVAGLATECGSPLRAGRVAGADAGIVARLRAAGAIVLGKTVTTEFAYFRPGPTRNPHDPGRTPGGSSSGSAAAVAAGMVPLAVGTQTAGSTVRPASFCGIAGHATATGALPYDGIAPMCPSLDTVGLFTGDVEGLAVVHAALRGGAVPVTASAPPELVVVDGHTLGPVEDETAALFAFAVSALAAAGARVRPGAIDPRLTADHGIVMAFEAAVSMRAEHHGGGLSPVLVELLDRGAAIDRADYEAVRARAAAARRTLLAALDEADAVIAPASLGPAPAGLDGTGDPACSRPWQLLGLPAVAVPGLRTAAGLPVGVALVGRPDAEDRLLSVARWVEERIRAAQTPL